MVQIVEQTQEEKVAMYMKLSKQELAAMLIAANDVIQNLSRHQSTYPSPVFPSYPMNPFWPIPYQPIYTTSTNT